MNRVGSDKLKMTKVLRATSATASLSRFLRQEALIRNGLERGVTQALAAPEEEPDVWEDHVRYQIETACIRGADNFLSYISEIIQLSIAKRPEMLKSSETITLDEAVRFSRHADLISFLIDRTVQRLSYRSFPEIEKFIADKTNIALVESEGERALLMTSIELRNIFAHARGEASEATMKRLEQINHPLRLRKGERVEADLFLVDELLSNLVVIARRADEKFARKFRLPRARLALKA